MALPGNNTNTDHVYYPPDSTLGVKHPGLDSNSSTSLRAYGESDKPKAEHEPLTREISRTPSPTPSEVEALNPDIKGRLLQFFNPKNWRRYGWYWLAIVLSIVFTVLISVFHEKIVRGLEPAAVWLRDGSKVGWLVPIAILIIISFPPLFGHEIVAALCGLVWGTWIGFGIVAAGTFFGEVANFYAFRYMCRSRAEKIEKKKIFYASLARVVRDGGFWIALVARYSAIPGHFTTAMFATCGMNIFVFSAAAILSLPKQFLNVYLGVLMGESVKNGGTTSKSRVITTVAFIATFVVTSFAMHYLLKKVAMVKPQVIYERRKARYAILSTS
ncbi:snare associated Golgi protein-domain-containing protein [Crepidotus variabilis]|uniref:Golgi apparatus membrane protein TVP38 n=1 Tax=Crepidotus variabilis TaxID=179855 RepID=A0A9P6E7S4_9AGAR|nr:snare associated Golgi protein-domain-containing protein [Crepidotus variabilis]